MSSLLSFVRRLPLEKFVFFLSFEKAQRHHSIPADERPFLAALFSFVLFLKVHSFESPLIRLVHLDVFEDGVDSLRGPTKYCVLSYGNFFVCVLNIFLRAWNVGVSLFELDTDVRSLSIVLAGSIFGRTRVPAIFGIVMIFLVFILALGFIEETGIFSRELKFLKFLQGRN